MSKSRGWEIENVERLTASLHHRLKLFRKIRRNLRTFDRSVRVIHLIKVAWNYPDDTFLMMNCEMNCLGEINCPDEYARTTKRRDRLWEFLLRPNPR